MELTPIGKEKLEVALTQKDMQRFRLTAEKLDYRNTETRRAVWTILDTAKHKTGFDAAKGKIRIDALPSKSGGCVIFITKTEKSATEESMANPKENYPVPIERPYKSLYGFSSLSDLLNVCRFLSAREYTGESSAFMDECGGHTSSKYYLALTEYMSCKDKSSYSVFENMFICEFGKKLSDEYGIAYVNEHCRCLCERNAVITLGKMA